MFGENLKKIRKLNKMGQVELAKKLNVANGTISMWENNLRTPDVATIKEISNLFKIPISYLIEDEIKIEPEESKSKTESRFTEKQRELLDYIQQLNDYQCKVAKVYFKTLLNDFRDESDIEKQIEKQRKD